MGKLTEAQELRLKRIIISRLMRSRLNEAEITPDEEEEEQPTQAPEQKPLQVKPQQPKQAPAPAPAPAPQKAEPAPAPAEEPAAPQAKKYTPVAPKEPEAGTEQPEAPMDTPKKPEINPEDANGDQAKIRRAKVKLFFDKLASNQMLMSYLNFNNPLEQAEAIQQFASLVNVPESQLIALLTQMRTTSQETAPTTESVLPEARKVTDAVVSAFLNGMSKKVGNTSTDGNALYLHGNKIAEKRNGQIWITNAGWFTDTTKERLNGLPGVNIQQIRGKWFWNGSQWDGEWAMVKDYDGAWASSKNDVRREGVVEADVAGDGYVDMSIAELASEIKRDWKNVYFGAKPYLDAMFQLDSIEDDYMFDSGRSVVAYFLANASTWRGPVAKAVKAELNKRLKSK